jgi:hypothetical protein
MNDRYNRVAERAPVEPARCTHETSSNNSNHFQHRVLNSGREDYHSVDESTLNTAFSRRSGSLLLRYVGW